MKKVNLTNEDVTALVLIFFFFIISSVSMQFIKSIGSWDAFEHLSLINWFSGYQTLPSMNIHSEIYPLFLSLFYRFIPSLTLLWVINIIFICIALFGTYLIAKQMKINGVFVLLLAITSPILLASTWNITPLVGALPFFVFGIYSLILYLEKEARDYVLFSALCFGVAGAVSLKYLSFLLPLILFTFLFIERKDFGIFFFALTIPLFIKGVFEFFIYGFPFEPVIRYMWDIQKVYVHSLE
ncbi:hypothetical protein GOV14_02105, partial [Candidatus Pacearchaeota archaeon]|nr:hypothetical protein [Candidatus Pacearchaeota archaeon]